MARKKDIQTVLQCWACQKKSFAGKEFLTSDVFGGSPIAPTTAGKVFKQLVLDGKLSGVVIVAHQSDNQWRYRYVIEKAD